ncbi:MAG: hypothetical protein HKN30_08665 [Sulfitobacter sp.]|nr:hypothetical protein [Sulfitobacter sp.]
MQGEADFRPGCFDAMKSKRLIFVILPCSASPQSLRDIPKVTRSQKNLQKEVGGVAMDTLQIILGLLWLAVGGFLYAGQLISTVNFPLAQRLGLQEKAENVNPLIGELERKAAAWDLFALWIPLLAGFLMLLDHAAWPVACLIASGIYFDAGGREWAKIRGLMAHGVPVGNRKERKVIFGTFSFFLITALAGILLGIAALV